MRYSASDKGMGILKAAGQTPYVVVLSGKDVRVSGVSLSDVSSLKLIEDKENRAFAQFASEQPKREQCLSAWRYLAKMYQADPFFASNKVAVAAINTEMKRLIDEETFFLNNLSKEAYVAWYLPIRKLVSNLSIVAQYRPEEIPTTFEALRAINYNDNRLHKSGLYKRFA